MHMKCIVVVTRDIKFIWGKYVIMLDAESNCTKVLK
jgi:hypothetical protein